MPNTPEHEYLPPCVYPPLEERVEIGAKHLDKIQPGWFHTVNTNTLRQSDCFYWVAAQVTGGSYSTALDKLMLHALGPISGGFSAGHTDGTNAWSELTRLWRTAIQRRRHNAHEYVDGRMDKLLEGGESRKYTSPHSIEDN